MKFYLPCSDHNYKDINGNTFINGGTVWLDNIARALRHHGHDAELIPLTGDWNSADAVILQSEWSGMPNWHEFKGKKICMLGHFCSHVYPDPKQAGADLYFSTWSGDVIKNFPHKVHFMPHAYSDLMDDGKSFNGIEIPFAGNTYPLRGESWIDGIGVEMIKSTHPEKMFGIYRGAKVCPNIHGPFQKNIVSTLPSRIANEEGTMINERFWNVLGADGVLVTDWTPQMAEFFDKEDLIIGENKEDFQEKIKYYSKHKQEGLDKLKKVREKIKKEHTYKERVKIILENL